MVRGVNERLCQQRLLHDLLVDRAERFPDREAVVVGGRSYRYGELLDASRRLALALVERGVRRGDRVAIYMDNSWPCIVSIYGALMAGAVFLVINPQTKREKLAFILTDSGANVLLTDGQFAAVFVDAVASLKGNMRVICAGRLSPELACYEAFDRVVAEAVVRGSSPAVGVIPSDLAALIYTSGSTGLPKGVMQTHQSMVFALQSIVEYLRMQPHDRVFLVLPMAFDYGLYQLLMSMSIGATLVIERSFTFLGLVQKHLREERITVFPGVPTIFSMLISFHRRKPLVFADVQIVTNTAAALPREFLPLLREMFPNAHLFKMYGQTECKRISYLEPEMLVEKPDSVGKAIPGTEVFLLSPEGRPVATGEAGILHVRGPHLMAGYWRQPQRSEEVLKPGKLPGERILSTQDWFRMDKEGYLYFLGRSDDMIKTRGEKVSPREVEEVLYALDGIKEARVVGHADELLGQMVHAYIAVEDGVALSAAQVKRFCAEHLENFMVPKEVTLLDELPKGPTGKIDMNGIVEEGSQ